MAEPLDAGSTRAIDNLRVKASEWVKVYNQFVAEQPDYSDPDYDRWARIKSSADMTKQKIQEVFDAAGRVYDWVSGAVRTVGNVFNTGVDNSGGMFGLGIAPVALAIPVIAAAAIAAIAITAAQMKSFLLDREKQRAKIALVNSGRASPSILDTTPPATGLTAALQSLGGLTKWVVIGGIAWIAWKQYQKNGGFSGGVKWRV